MRKQLDFSFGRGGYRRDSGRKRIHSRGVAHRKREKVLLKTPLHINFKYQTQIKNKFCLRLLKRAILNARKHGLRVNHFSLQHNHVHLIVEAETNVVLTKGMRSITVTMAKGLKSGKVQIERYHLHVLKSLRETKNAVLYVLFNKQKHEKGTYSTVDEYSSILYVKEMWKALRMFVKKENITLKIERIENEFILDPAKSWFLINCLESRLS